MTRRVNDLMIALAVAVSAASLYFIFLKVTIPGMPAGLAAAFGTVLPGLIVTGLAILEAINVRGGIMAAGSYTVMGIGLALTLFELNAAGVINAAMLAPATLEQIQILIIVIGFLLGVAAYRGS